MAHPPTTRQPKATGRSRASTPRKQPRGATSSSKTGAKVEPTAKAERTLFNASLDGSTRRAIDLREGDVLDAAAFKASILAAVAENLRDRRPTITRRRAVRPIP